MEAGEEPGQGQPNAQGPGRAGVDRDHWGLEGKRDYVWIMDVPACCIQDIEQNPIDPGESLKVLQ